MSDVNPWISDLKRQDLQQIESQPFGRPGGDHCYVMWCYDIAWNVMPCHLMLRHVVLCYVMLCYATLCCVMLHYLVSCFAMLCYYYVFWYFGYACMHVWRVCVYFSYHIHIIIHPYLVPQRVGYNLSYNWTKCSWGQQASKSPPPNRSVIFHEFIQIPSNPHRIPLISQ